LFDLAIIGAGPAGATLARLTAPYHKVLLLETRDLEKAGYGSDKCCGGLLAPDAQQALAELGLGLPKNILVGPQLFAVRTIDLDNGLERYYQRHYINMDRGAFDRWLVSLIPRSADVRHGCRLIGLERTKGGVRVRYVRKGRENTEESRILVGADGAGSMVRKLAFPDRPWPRRYVSIQAWFESQAPPYFSSIFDRSVTDFYSWTIPKEDRLVVGTAVPLGQDPAGRFELMLSKLRDKGYALGKPLRKHGAFILRPGRLSEITTGNERVALVGEAAGWISPSSAEGISYAFRSAAALAGALREDAADTVRGYYRRTRKLRSNILCKIAKSPFMYSPFPRKLVMRSGVGSLRMSG
jgi:flavin-dependent dehydrogenase